MSVPTFDESTKADKLPVEVFRWLKEAAMYARSTPNSAEEVYDSLKLLLRLLAVRNPESQSHATREALGSLIEAIYTQPHSEKIVHDLLALFMRMIDAKQGFRYNPMKHLAISGLGYLSKYLSENMGQMSANVFIISLESLKICPVEPATRLYRNTLVWTMRESATTKVDEGSVKVAYKYAKTIIESAQDSDADREGVSQAFLLLAKLISLPAGKAIEKKTDSFQSLFLNHGISTPHLAVRDAAATFYCAVLTYPSSNHKQDVTNIVNTVLKLRASSKNGVDYVTTCRLNGYIALLLKVLDHEKSLELFESDLEEWLAPTILQLPPALSKKLLVHGILKRKLDGHHSGVDIAGVFLRQLALSRAQPSQKLAAKSKSYAKIARPTTESTLACLADTIAILGSSIQPSAVSIQQATLGLICNSSDALTDEQLGWCVLCLIGIVRSCPPLLITTIEMCLKQLEAASASSSVGVQIAYAIGAMVAESKTYAFYGDVDLNSRVVLLAIDNIKRRNDIVSYKVGWALLCGALRLGADVVKPLVPHLLLLWEHHLSPEACQYPEFIERSLTGLLVFFTHNQPLLTADVASRLGQCLYTLWTSLENTAPNHWLRRRILQCYDQLLSVGRLEAYPSSLLMKFIAHISSSDQYSKDTGVTIESAMVLKSKNNGTGSGSGSSGNGNSTAILSASDLLLQSVNAVDSGIGSTVNDSRAAISNDVDYVVFCGEAYNVSDEWVSSSPRDVYTEVVDLAVKVTAKLLPLQPFRIQESVFDSILANIENSQSSRSPRQVAVIFNVSRLLHITLAMPHPLDPAILRVFVSIIKILLKNPAEEIREVAAESCGSLAERLKVSAGENNASSELFLSFVRELMEFSASAGRASANGASTAIVSQDMYRSIGAISALGYIVKQRPEYSLLEASFKILMQLAASPNVLVHNAAVAAMVRALTTTEFIDLKYVKLTLKTLSLTYLLESHTNSLRFQREVAEGLVQVVSRFGPMLATDQQKSNHDLIICFADQLQSNPDPKTRVLAWKCFIEIYYYARQGIAWPLLIKRWKKIIVNPQSPEDEIDAAINGLLVLMRLSARTILGIAGSGFEDALWLLLDRHPEHPELRALFSTWMDQTTDSDSAFLAWIRLLATVAMKPRYFFMNRLNAATNAAAAKGSDIELSAQNVEKKASVNPTAVAADEDVALDVQSEDTSNELFSWQARNFALDLLYRLLRADLSGKSDAAKAESVTTKAIGEIIKISFSSSTSQILGLQLSGLALLNEIMIQLSDLVDPDFPQISLLAQYQVQIISALSPAFRSGSTPGLALAALNCTGTFITSNIVNSKEKVSRLVKILEESLASINGNTHQGFKLGSLEMSPDATHVLKVAVLATWARISNASSESKPHLLELVEPHKEKFVELWTEVIFDIGKMSSPLELQWSSLSAFGSAVDQMREIQSRRSMEPIYKLSWLTFVTALSRNDAEDVNFRLVLCGLCFQALFRLLHSSGSFSQHESTNEKRREDSNGVENDHTFTGSSQSQFNPVIHGAYYSQTGSDSQSKLPILLALQQLLIPSACEQVMRSSNEYFEEMVSILYRVMLIGAPEEQIAILNIARSLVSGQDETDDSVDHFFEVLKVVILPLRRMFPGLFTQDEQITVATSAAPKDVDAADADADADENAVNNADENSDDNADDNADDNNAEDVTVKARQTTSVDTHHKLSAEQISLLHHTMDTMIDIAQVFREVIQNDLWVCLLQVFEELNHSEPVVVAPSFKRLLEILAAQVEVRGVTFVLGALTVALKRAVNRESTSESLLISTAITCTNSRSLYGPNALAHVYQFGVRAGESLFHGTKSDATEEERGIATTAVQCINAVFRVCADTPTGGAFAYACLPYIVNVLGNAEIAKSDWGLQLVKQSASALTIFAVMDGALEAFAIAVPALIAADALNPRGYLLQLMTRHPAVFKQCVWQLDPADRELLQGILAQPTEEEPNAADISEEDSEDEGQEISLKSFA